MDFFKKFRGSQIAVSIVIMLVGIVLIIWPGLIMDTAVRIAGALLLVWAIVQIALFIKNHNLTVMYSAKLIMDIVFAIMGVIFLTKPGFIISIIPFVIGLFILIHGIKSVIETIALKKNGYANWAVSLGMGVLTILLGVLLVVNPWGAAELGVQIMGAFLIYTGAANLWITSRS